MTKIDIFSGFLGAGKTTLIKKLIADAFTGEKVVLIENEFGDISIDGGFLKDSGIEITEMSAGCICCSLVGDFKEALQKVIDELKPDRILIEPSGVGKLSEVITAVKGIEEGNDVVLNHFVTVADVAKCKMYMKNFGEFYNDQIACAKTIILSRTQNVDEKKLDEALALIREKNSEARILTTPWDELDSKTIMEAMEASSMTLQDELLKDAHEHHHHHRHDEECECHHEHHHHDEEECECHHEHHHHDEEECECHHEHHHHHDEECECHHEGEVYAIHGLDCPHCAKRLEKQISALAGVKACHIDFEDEEIVLDLESEAVLDAIKEVCAHFEDGIVIHAHGEKCHCGHHHRHDHHHADDVFTTWGVETTHVFTKEDLTAKLEALSTGEYGDVLRCKGIVRGEDTWYYFDMVPGEAEVREGKADYTGRLVVIGASLKEAEIKRLFLGE